MGKINNRMDDLNIYLHFEEKEFQIYSEKFNDFSSLRMNFSDATFTWRLVSCRAP